MARGRLDIAVVTLGLALGGLSLGLLGADPVPAQGAAAPVAAPETPKTPGLVGGETCAMCHEDTAKAFLAGPHGQAMAVRSKTLPGEACERCHGAGGTHVDDPNTANIVRHPKDEACLSCHSQAGGLMALSLPGHDRTGVPKCLDCHVPGHGPAPAKPLLAGVPSAVCAKCHGQVAVSFKMPYSHRKGNDPFECTACHTAHGNNRTGRLQQTGPGTVCLECHTDKSGPYIYPHPPRAVDGCIQCHTPHGSMNPMMLTRPQVAQVCLECHTALTQRHNISDPRYRNCQNCHIGIHGSNHSRRLLDE